jgi:glycosyltransferase involved in cell wall biosynthesis
MRIAFIGQKGIPARSGGVEKHVEQLAVRMTKEGHEVFVYVRSHYTDLSLKQYEGVKLIHLPSLYTKNLDAITHTFFATLHALFCRYDIIHYHSIGPSTLSFIPRLLKRKTRVVATFHSPDYLQKKWGWFARWYLRLGEYLICTVPEKTIVVSEGLHEYVSHKYGCDATMIPNGAETEQVTASDALARYGLKEKKYILSVGRLVKHKGIHYLIKAFEQLEDTNRLSNNFKLVIVGKNSETPEYERYLRVMSQGRINVMFLGEQTGETLAQLFAHAYVFVQPSESEGMSIALLEAMGHGLACLTSDIDANKEVVDTAGLTFENKNVEDLKNKLAYLLNREEEVKELGEKARRRVAEHYSWEAIAKRTLRLYRELLLQKESARPRPLGAKTKVAH